jgi:outer membrane protein OmpU
MKKLLIATTALVAMTGAAVAEVNVSGTGRMGVLYDDAAASDFSFTSRIRIIFTASGTTDNGLTFGGSIRADNAGGGNAGNAGNVFISGAFGRITMGDVSGAPEAAVGDLHGVGLTGLNDWNEFTYLSNAAAGDRPAARYDYAMGEFSFHLSADNPGNGDDVYGIAVKYTTPDFYVGLGYESHDNFAYDDHWMLGAGASFQGVDLKAAYGRAGLALGGHDKQYGLSASAEIAPATTASVYWRRALDGNKFYGLGASYDLGGGASVVGGIARDKDNSNTVADLGVSMSF